MAKSNGIKDLKQAAKLLNKHAPKGESLAYINPGEARLLKAHGGSGIETLSGVPSYNWFTETVLPWIVEKGSDVVDWLGYSQDGGGGKELIKDVGKLGLSTLAFFEAKKDREGLTAHEQKIYNDLKAQGAAADLQFALNVGEGPKVENVPTTIEDVASFTDVTLPTMKTTAVAEGGRIGYNLGGIGAMDPRIGYAEGLGPMGRQMGRQMGPGETGIDLSYFRDKIYSPAARTLAGTSGEPGGLLQETKYDRDTNTRDFTFSEDITMPGQKHTRQTLDAANQMLDIQEMKKLQLEKLALKKGWTKEQFDKRYWELVQQQKGGVEGWGESTQYDDINEALSMLEYDIGVWSNWEGDQDPQSVDMRLQNPNYLPLPESMQSAYEPNAYGGRIGAKEGGIMPLLNLGGMEKDYRQDGGFVPIGRREKADDVPARLSKNEFVFTADAVRNAGGGNIDKGAQRMYNVMKNLEAGGEISEQSQGQV